MSVNIFDKQKGDIIQVAGNAFNNTDIVARNAIAAHEGNTVVHVTAAEKATWNGKAEMSDIPTTLPANGGNADTVDGKHASDLAYLTDVIGGLKLGYASANAGTIMTYGDREVIKTTSDLSYFGWTINTDGWFVPIVVSQYSSGTHYEMFGNKFGYGISQDSECASFAYKGRTYYACWSNGGAYLNPTVVGGLHLTLTNNNYISACKTLIDACEAIDSDTVDGKHASDFALKTDIPTTLPANGGMADAARETVSPNAKAKLWEDSEGGNLRLVSPDGHHYVEMDVYDNNIFRMYFVNEGSNLSQALTYNFITDKLDINGDADTVDGKHASDFATSDDNYFLYTFSAGGDKHGTAHRLVAKHNVKNDGRFYIQGEDEHLVRVNYADGADTANTAGTLATTASNVCLRNMSSGTAAATTDNCPVGAWYGKHS